MSSNFNDLPLLTTENLILRALAPEDGPEVLALRSDPLVNLHIDRSPCSGMNEALAFIEKIRLNVSDGNSFYWAIALKTDQKLIGTICYWNLSAENEAAEVGYELRPQFQGKGFMQQALAEVIRFGFEILNLKLITACPKKGNTKSIQLLMKNKFRIDTARKFSAGPDDDYTTYYLEAKNYK